MKIPVLVRGKSRNVEAANEAKEIANRLQSEFEFDVELVRWLPKGNGKLAPKQVLQLVKRKHASKPTIVVISPPLEGNYFEFMSRGRNIVSTANWESRYAPPPLRIYLLFQFAYAAALFVANLSPSQIDRRMVHNGFRGCIFNSTVGRRKFLSVLIAGYLCGDCEARLCEWGVSDKALESIGNLLSYVRDFAVRKPRKIPTSIFIGHGRRMDWKEVRSHLVDSYGLNVDEFSVYPSAGITTVERLTQMLESACFAILVMTAEDPQKGGKRKARQNVVHEIGLFQGRLGFPRAIILKENGAEEFSNVKGLTYIPFKKGGIAEAFPEIDRALVRERVISTPVSTPK
jgi:Predicted nucleotide-binding protein containing TIR-like domain